MGVPCASPSLRSCRGSGPSPPCDPARESVDRLPGPRYTAAHFPGVPTPALPTRAPSPAFAFT